MSSFGHRPSVEELLAAYEIDQGLVNPRPRWIWVFDDVLTAGTHFSSDEEHTAAQLSRGSSLRFSSEIAPELTGHGLPLSKCEAYNRVYDQFYQSR